MTAAPIGRVARRRPLFIQVFVVMVLSVLAAQLANFALVLLSPPPVPQLHTSDDVVFALMTGRDTTGQLAITLRDDPGFDERDPRASALKARMARQLGVAPDALRLSLPRPPLVFARRGHDLPPMVSVRIEGMPPPGPPAILAGNIAIARFSAALRQPGGRWRVVAPRHTGLDPWQRRAMFWLLGTIVFVAPFAWLLARRIAAPLGAFAAAAERLGRDPKAPPLSVRGPAEIEAATHAFNEMQERLRRYVDDRTAMIGAIAHDLRTPLMRLSFRLENVPEAIRNKAETDIREMESMLAAVLAFVRDMGEQGRRQKLDLRSLVESIADNMADMGEDVSVEPGDTIVLNGDVVGLRSLFANLLSNAVKYGQRARVALRAEDGMAIVEIEDDGPGIAPAELDRVFEPFYRTERSRSRDTGGTGLGLATVRTLAHAHGGEAILENRAEGGLRARVKLPL